MDDEGGPDPPRLNGDRPPLPCQPAGAETRGTQAIAVAGADAVERRFGNGNGPPTTRKIAGDGP